MCVGVPKRWAWLVVVVVVVVARGCGAGAVGPSSRQPVVVAGTGGGTERPWREDLAVCGAALLKELHTITDLVLRIQTQSATPPVPPPAPALTVHDCSTLQQAGIRASGVYQLFPFTFRVYCDMTSQGGGWTVIQRRLPQEVQEDFARGWSSYRRGFGDLEGEVWLGLEPLHQLTNSGDYQLRVDMVDYQLGHKHAEYQVFRVAPESEGYRLLVANYSGTAGDALSTFHSGRRFSTYDRDQDLAVNKSCALEKEGGWWFHACYSAHPNGRLPVKPARGTNGTEMRWWASREQVLVLTFLEMKIRRRPHHHHIDPEVADDQLPKHDPRHDNDHSPDGDDRDDLDDDDEDDDLDWTEEEGFYNSSGQDHRSDVSPWEVISLD